MAPKRKTTPAQTAVNRAKSSIDPEAYLRSQLTHYARQGTEKAKPERAEKCRQIAISLALYLMPFDKAKKMPAIEHIQVKVAHKFKQV